MPTIQEEQTDGESVQSFRSRLVRDISRIGVPFLFGGTEAYQCYTGRLRPTKDLDLFVRQEDVREVLKTLSLQGYVTSFPFKHWLAKARSGDHYADLIFGFGNGVGWVDQHWFRFAQIVRVYGRKHLICPVEEMIWSKVFICERERYDGADVMHLIHEFGPRIDWPRLLWRFGTNWPVLLSQLVMFEFIYPNRRHVVPDWLMRVLLNRARDLKSEPANLLCNGTLVSRRQYLLDLKRGYHDPRLTPHGSMTRQEIKVWTDDAFRQTS